jgi:hypothetical protein
LFHLSRRQDEESSGSDERRPDTTGRVGEGLQIGVVYAPVLPPSTAKALAVM